MASRANTRTTYDRLSRWYDLLSGSSERQHRHAGIRALAVRPGERVLEIGAGTGDALTVLARLAGPAGLACGLDLSPGMCRVAQQRLRRSPEIAAALLCGDAACQPFPADAFDVVFLSFTLELFAPPDMTAVLGECRRVLRPAGRLGVVALSDHGPPNTMRRLYSAAHRRFPDWVDCRPIAVADTLSAHGFTVATVAHSAMWGLTVEVVVAGKASASAGKASTSAGKASASGSKSPPR